MFRGFRHSFRRALPLLAAFGLLSATPGCGDGTKKDQGTAAPVPTNVQESNKNMENFMKTQQKK